MGELSPEVIGAIAVGAATIIGTAIGVFKSRPYRNLSDGDMGPEARSYQLDRLNEDLVDLRRDNDQLRRDIEDLRRDLAACERRNVALMERLLRRDDGES